MYACFDLFDLVSVYVQNTSSRGSVDIHLVHHVAVRVFSCTLVEECYLYCKVMTSILTCMSLTLARLCGKCCMIHFRHFVSKMVRYLCPEIQLIQGMKKYLFWEKYLWEKVSLPRSFVGKISRIYILVLFSFQSIVFSSNSYPSLEVLPPITRTLCCCLFVLAFLVVCVPFRAEGSELVLLRMR